jgi:hypothetical protein
MVLFILSLVLAPFLGIVGNLLTPGVQAWLLNRRSRGPRRERRIAAIRKETEIVGILRSAEPSRAIGVAASLMARLMPLWAFAVVCSLGSLIADLSSAKGIGGLQDILAVAMPVTLAYAVAKTNRVLGFLGKMDSPDEAAKYAEKQLTRLGAGPDDTHPEDAAGSPLADELVPPQAAADAAER